MAPVEQWQPGSLLWKDDWDKLRLDCSYSLSDLKLSHSYLDEHVLGRTVLYSEHRPFTTLSHELVNV